MSMLLLVCVLTVNKRMCLEANRSYINVTTGAPGTNNTYCMWRRKWGAVWLVLSACGTISWIGSLSFFLKCINNVANSLE